MKEGKGRLETKDDRNQSPKMDRFLKRKTDNKRTRTSEDDQRESKSRKLDEYSPPNYTGRSRESIFSSRTKKF